MSERRPLLRRPGGPILFIVCEADSVAPGKATLRHARAAPRHEIHLYPAGHFEIYLGQAFERAVGDQTAFLEHYVPPRTGSPAQ
jgi:pimeloyl-ACP methyl ester carboxylesterase